MSEDQVASAVETAPEDDSVIPNGKGHEPGEGTATSTPPAGNEEKWVFSLILPSSFLVWNSFPDLELCLYINMHESSDEHEMAPWIYNM